MTRHKYEAKHKTQRSVKIKTTGRRRTKRRDDIVHAALHDDKFSCTRTKWTCRGMRCAPCAAVSTHASFQLRINSAAAVHASPLMIIPEPESCLGTANFGTRITGRWQKHFDSNSIKHRTIRNRSSQPPPILRWGFAIKGKGNAYSVQKTVVCRKESIIVSSGTKLRDPIGLRKQFRNAILNVNR